MPLAAVLVSWESRFDIPFAGRLIKAHGDRWCPCWPRRHLGSTFRLPGWCVTVLRIHRRAHQLHITTLDCTWSGCSSISPVDRGVPSGGLDLSTVATLRRCPFTATGLNPDRSHNTSPCVHHHQGWLLPSCTTVASVMRHHTGQAAGILAEAQQCAPDRPARTPPEQL